MKNTTFRKKALLSSVAMLLVALVALGSATFAWFTANPKADASGLSLKTTASTGLVIRTDSDTQWDHSVELYSGQAAPFNLDPVSQVQGDPDTFFKIQAGTSSNYAAAADQKFAAAQAGSYQATGDYYTENVYFKFSEGTAANETGKVLLDKVTITKSSAATMHTCVRVALADSEGNLLGTYALSGAKPNDTVPAGADGKLLSEITLVPYKTDSYDFSLTSGTAKNSGIEVSNVGTAEDTTNNFVTVYVYLDGQDGDCASDNVGSVNASEIIQSIKLDFKLADN